MKDKQLHDFITMEANEFKIPGVAIGVITDDREIYACHGVTSRENPLPVDQDTLFILGSVTKTFTATTLMRLVVEGKVRLDAPVRQYVPELQLADEQSAKKITVLHLLNHTSGLDWRVNVDSGEGDDALARELAKLAELKLIAPPGTRASYSQAGFDLIGRIIEKVTGKTYEQAVASLLFEPLELSHSLFSRDDVMTRRFAVGHNRDENGKLSIARPWKHWRSNNPGGGLASSVADQIRWARFHLGDGHSKNGTRVLPAEVLHQMQEQTVTLRGSSLGDAFGICWFLREVDGVRTIGHGGSANGQFAELLIVPARNFAVVSLSNSDPNGIPFNQAVVRWTLKNYLGLVDSDRKPMPFDVMRAQEIVGNYQNDFMTLTIEADGAGMRIDIKIRPEIRAGAKTELPPDPEPTDMGLLPGDKDEYIITNGAYKGQRGFFTRDKSGVITGVDLAGRLFSRAKPSKAP
ncbi:MAG: serine hydrolase domain-containing protein [Ktedonobacteraceae bacterium]